jgi:hypothetical protein
MTHTARTYNVSVNHRRRILYTTSGHPARWNDKTLVLFDDFAGGIHSGKLLDDVEFELWELDDEGNEVAVKYRGCWLMVDNGYLKWSTTVPPFKNSLSRREIRWSEWIESLRKDVECTFGILKGRWRILKAGVRVHGVEVTDKIFKTCCALHNWLLDVDGLDEQWEQGVPSEWEGELGWDDEELGWDDEEDVRRLCRMQLLASIPQQNFASTIIPKSDVAPIVKLGNKPLNVPPVIIQCIIMTAFDVSGTLHLINFEVVNCPIDT